MDYISQGMRDLVTPATLAFQDDDLGAQDEAKKSWKEIAESFWMKTAAASEETKSKRAKPLHRTKVYEWLCATCHMLQCAIGGTWETRPDENISNTMHRST